MTALKDSPNLSLSLSLSLSVKSPKRKSGREKICGMIGGGEGFCAKRCALSSCITKRVGILNVRNILLRCIEWRGIVEEF